MIRLRFTRARPRAAVPRAAGRPDPRRPVPLPALHRRAAHVRGLDRLALDAPAARDRRPALARSSASCIYVARTRAPGSEPLLGRVDPGCGRPRPASRGRLRARSSCRSSSARSARRCSRPRSGSPRSATRRPRRCTWSRCRSRAADRRRLADEEERAAASLAEAKLLAEEHGVDDRGPDRPRARDRRGDRRPGGARADADLIVLGSRPRWRRQSRFFSPTVDYVLRTRACEVMVIAYPAGRPRGGLEAPLARYADCMKAIVIGCGRVGSRSRKSLDARRAGTSSAIDEKEEALGRLGEGWGGGFIVGHGMDVDAAREAGIEDAQTRSSSPRTATTRISSSGRSPSSASTSARRRPHPRPGPRGVLRAARAGDRLPDPDGDRAADRPRPRERAPTERSRRRTAECTSIVAGGGKVGSNVARSLLARGHEVTLIEQRRDRFERLEQEFEHRVHPRRRDRALRARAGRHRAAARPRRRGHRRRRGQHRHLPGRARALRRRRR